MGKDLNGKELGKGITQRKDGRYVARFTNRFGLRPEIKSYDLEKLKTDFENAKYEDRHKMNIAEKKSLNDWFPLWMDVYKYGLLRPSSIVQYKNMFFKHISPELGTMFLDDVEHFHIKKLINKMDKEEYSFEMKNKARILLFDMFNIAILNNLARKNPCRNIRISFDEDKDVRVLTREEQSIFFDASSGTFYNNAFNCHVESGLRPGELFALEEKNLDFKNSIIHVERTLSYQKFEGDGKKTFHFGPPKTKTSHRDVPMTDQFKFYAKKQILQKKVVMSRTNKEIDKKFENLLFTTTFGTPINSQIYIDAIDRVLKEINLMLDTAERIDHFSGHCFRHTFATRCFESEIRTETIQRWLGHASPNMTTKLYVHVLEDFQELEIIKLQNNPVKSVDELTQDKINSINKGVKLVSA